MRKAGMLAILTAGAISLAGCSTYGNDRQLRDAGTGAAIGAAAGAGIGAVTGGSVVGGAVAGGVVGGAVGALTSENRRWYRDNRGYCYYTNDRGERIYDYNRRC